MNGQTPATGQNKRSRTGCLRCLKSKVKCDESHPVCRRCERTKKECMWPELRSTLRERRRGQGPYKDRVSKVLYPLVPASQSPPENFVAPESPLPDTRSGTEGEGGEEGNSAIAIYTGPLDTSQFDVESTTSNLQSFDTNKIWTEAELDYILNGSHNWVQNFASQQHFDLTSSVPYALQHSMTPSSSSVVIRRPEWEAMQYFERVFGTIYSPKPFPWSICAIMADYGKNHGVIQHLIIAVCLGQLDQAADAGSLWQLGKTHYQTGAGLLMQEMQQKQSDHCKVFIAFWLMQAAYNTFWGDKAATNSAKLSQAIAQYTRKYQLLKLFCGDSTCIPGGSQNVDVVTQKSKSLLSRLMIFSLYEDIDAEYCHAGGSFATEVCGDEDAIRALYNAGRNVFSHYFEGIYPQDELIDDIQRASLLDLHFEANLMLHKINQASSSASPQHAFEQIARTLEALKLQHSFAFQSTQIENQDFNKVLSSANNVVAHFLAVETYNLQYLQTYAPDSLHKTQLQSALQNLLRTIGNLCRERPTNLPYRNQWLFFVAAISTKDQIHIAWIIDKLKKGRYYDTLRRTLDIQRASRVEMSIHDIRSLFWGGEYELLYLGDGAKE